MKRTIYMSLVPCISLITLALTAASAFGQAILVTEPLEWRSKQALSTIPGSTLRIAGSVTHPAGVSKVLVNGQEATIRVDQTSPDYFVFERSIEIYGNSSQVTITVVPPSGAPYSKQFDILKSALDAAVQQGTIKAAGPSEVSSANPWRPLQLRSIAYGAAAVGGVAIGVANSGSRSVGFAVAGAAVVAFAIDAIITSRHASPGPTTSTSNARLQWLPLTVSGSMREARVDLLRLRP
jgi:hypothetical protein